MNKKVFNIFETKYSHNFNSSETMTRKISSNVRNKFDARYNGSNGYSIYVFTRLQPLPDSELAINLTKWMEIIFLCTKHFSVKYEYVYMEALFY